MVNNIRVLHVDDEPNFAEVTAEFLHREDDRIDIVTETSASEGLDRLARDDFDCVVSDFDMPGQNGIEFLERVREEYPNLPFILYTGKGSEKVASEAISAGVTDYLQKGSGTDQYELLANEIVEFVEKYRTGQELDELRRQFTKVVEQNFVGIYIIQDGEFTYVNPRLADIHGYDSPDQVVGKSPLDLVAPEERERVQSNLHQRMSGEVAEIHYQTTGLTKDGECIDIELHGSRIELDGEPAVIGAEADITAQKKRERSLERFKNAVNHAGNAIYMTDSDGTIEYVNPAFEETTGYPADEAVGSDHRILQSGEMPEGYYEELWETVLEGKIWKEETINRRHNGEKYYAQQTIAPISGENGDIDGVVGIQTDITERKEKRVRLEFLETLENELTELSIDFLQSEQRNIDALIDHGLGKIGRLVEADRSYVFQIDHEAETLSNTHEWCAEGIEPQIDMLQNIDFNIIPWLLPQLRNNESVAIPEVAELPPKAEELQRILTEQNIASLLVVPMISDGTLVGFIGLDWVQEQESWSQEFIDILRMAGELITSARRQEARRRELERHEAYLEHSQDIITEVDDNGTITYHNPAMARVLGIDSEDRLGDRVFEYVHPVDRQRMETQFEEFVNQEAESTSRIEFRYEDAEGSYRWLESIGVDQTDTRVGSYVIYSRDITKRKKREEKYRKLFEENRDALMVFDRDGYLDCNEHALELFGIDSVDDFLDYSPSELSPPKQPDGRNSKEAAMEHIETAYQEGVDFFEWTHQRVDGKEFSSEVKLSRFSYGSETVILALIRDITERKDRERELATARQASQKLIEASPVPIWVQEVEEILYSNDAAATFFGHDDSESLIGTSALSFVPENERERARKRNEEMLETGEAMDELPGKVVTKDGTTRDAVFAAAPITYYGKEAIVTIANDITERKEQKEQLRREKERLDEFASLVSHDLRNPLQVAQGRLALAQEECDSEHLDDAAYGIERSLDLIKNLLALARGGQEIGELEPVDMSDLGEDCWNTVDTADASIVSPVESTIRADRARLRQLLENLFHNAVEHGGEDVTVSIGQLEDGFYVEDDGSGIQAGEREDVFESGYSGSQGGTGFGLSIVKQIVEAHGWDIQISEGPEGGARFEISGVEIIDE